MAKGIRSADDWNDDLLRDVPPSRRYLIGVSGGRDSIALLHWLLTKGYKRLIVCHLDHRLRGRASATDARFVERTAKAAGLAFVSATADVRKLAKESRQSLETTARTARYEFFASLARRRRCTTIFLGHHADDLVETFLMNLFRGAANEGLRSIQSVSIHKVGATALTVVRPMLGIWREEIDRYAETNQLKFREDATNQSLQPTRNRMRHRIIPFLEKEFGRGIRRTIWRTATIASDEEKWTASLVSKEATTSRELSVAKLVGQPIALQRRVIRSWLRAQEVSDLDFELIERVRALLDPRNGVAKTNLPGDRHVRRRAKKIFIEEPTPKRRSKA